MAEQIVRETVETNYWGTIRRTSWGAIFAGTIVGLMISLILGLLGLAIGAATIHPTTEARPMEGLGIAAMIWWALTTIVSLFVGGCVAGRLAGVRTRADAMLHGVVTWGFVTLIALFAVGSTVGGILSGATRFITAGLPVAGQVMATGSTSAQEPAGAQALPSTKESKAPQDQGEAAGANVNEQQAREVGASAASITAKAALGGLIALLLGGIAGAVGGWVGMPRRIEP